MVVAAQHNLYPDNGEVWFEAVIQNPLALDWELTIQTETQTYTALEFLTSMIAVVSGIWAIFVFLWNNSPRSLTFYWIMGRRNRALREELLKHYPMLTPEWRPLLKQKEFRGVQMPDLTTVKLEEESKKSNPRKSSATLVAPPPAGSMPVVRETIKRDVSDLSNVATLHTSAAFRESRSRLGGAVPIPRRPARGVGAI
uniref:Uncharacterized protein n=1 Tax=Lotharella oceanica TaxID=641309 RepID=A0A7S2X764_9EUKA|mmetsp:Transcript_15876/g.30126  ORF Transcript_15876/g.30126 Transcript_15876/m.30126 type:complete len:198 (+) Transcript_15876:309-902(+)|eukprot:CAMPEP_0170191164 /NCGR_PEP_ID=MMETSP0040_2-20121228/51019_1 /TAXON_ID=641309 /ORGANISM="Lotharella oceanica, Strain CCMP622" /LENGTH=197 /DNA_ID=CAMNT_0010439179 /DNA_START=296 /DNA_END=889 /DNA_ORIENTATION=-